MTISDVIEYAKYGELAQLGVVKQLKSTTPADVIEAEKQILSYINMGLLELYIRFTLRTEETVITLSANTTLYTITNPNFNSVYAVYDEEGKQYVLNDEEDPLSVLTPNYNTIQVPNPVEGATLYILYSAIPDKILWSASIGSSVVPLSPMMLEALLHYVGYRAHASMNGNVDGENNTHYVRFEASCKKLREIGAVADDALSENKHFDDKGFV
jgi:hypothetical protein